MENQNLLNSKELTAALAARQWGVDDLVRWLATVGHPVDAEIVARWVDGRGEDAAGTVPRWPFLLLECGLQALPPKPCKYFKASEFRAWWHWMHPGLLAALDYARAALDAPLQISPASGALGRHLQREKSLHNVDRYGYCMAADVLVPPGMALDKAFRIVHWAGVFSGIGVYPHWKPRPGLHLDVRHLSPLNPTPEARPAAPAGWSAVREADGRQV